MNKEVYKQKEADELRKSAEEKLISWTIPVEEISDADGRKLVHELQVYQIELEMQNEELRKALIQIEASRQKYTRLYDFAPVGYFTVDKKGLILEANLTGAVMLGMERGLLINIPLSKFIAREGQDAFYLHCRHAFETKKDERCELRMVKKDGVEFYARLESSGAQKGNGNFNQIRTIITDITERKKAQDMLQEQKTTLEQKNIALSEVLGQIEFEKKQIKDNVIANAENLLLPIIQKLRLRGGSRKYVQLLQKNLQELTSSFGTRMIREKLKLTSREIEICNMIRNGFTSKEIANLLNTSRLTIHKHRANIRKKLGITNKDINLSSFLIHFN